MYLHAAKIGVDREGKQVLRDISLAVGPGEWIVLAGANGAGKSTLLDVLAGMMEPTSGQVIYGEMPQSGGTIRASYLYQSPETGLFAATAVEEFAFSLQRRRSEVEQLWADIRNDHLKPLGLGHVQPVDVPLRWSTGMQRKFAYALAKASQPPLLLLDEPTAGLDADARRALLDALAHHVEAGGSVIAATHDLDEMLTFATRVIVLASGSIQFDGLGRDLARHPELLLEAGIGLPPMLRVAAHLHAAGLIADMGLYDADEMATAVCQAGKNAEAACSSISARGLEASGIGSERQEPVCLPANVTTEKSDLGHPMSRWLALTAMTVTIALVHTRLGDAVAVVATAIMLVMLRASWRMTLRLSRVWVTFALLASAIAGIELGPPFHVQWAFHFVAFLRTLRYVVPYWCFLQLGQLFVSDFTPLAFGAAIHDIPRRLGLPVHWCRVCGWTATLVCRFIPAIDQMYRLQLRAYQARTLTWDKRNIHRLPFAALQIANVLSPFLIRLLRVGETTADAMAARSVFHIGFPADSYRPSRMDRRDALTLFTGLALASAIVLGR
ncbi:hypothetical protein Alches_02120 [Alicyclobacillus hesperidum subsp. aegles]|uniref:ATP-binding cassette domain-containing protein n=1 Tax=Alicyclobacillus hesperidum TaxID=89784 RepID=UPI00222D48E2|nr:ATP-binding cassette domain-containing protein [Alicyclobacillus hesperidum]GLG00173.1 hypothetical protein Alches_02120 [Alicyclobacillus hesperidum subsp. aegles]